MIVFKLRQEQVRGFVELITLQQEQLEVQRREIYCLSSSVRSSVRSLQIQPREDQPYAGLRTERGDYNYN